MLLLNYGSKLFCKKSNSITTLYAKRLLSAIFSKIVFLTGSKTTVENISGVAKVILDTSYSVAYVRMYNYVIFKSIYFRRGYNGAANNAVASMVTGAVAAFISTPTDVI